MFIHDHVADFPVQVMCEVLGVSRGGYYAWASRAESARTADDRVRMERDILKKAALIFGQATGRR